MPHRWYKVNNIYGRDAGVDEGQVIVGYPGLNSVPEGIVAQGLGDTPDVADQFRGGVARIGLDAQVKIVVAAQVAAHRHARVVPGLPADEVQDNYPVGPVLLSDIGGFFRGSGAFKTSALRELRKRFTNIEIGIGDKISDARSYYDNYMQSFLIILTF